MLRYLLDTDHLTLLEQGHVPLVQRLALEAPGAVGTSAITVEEAVRGRLGVLSRRLNSQARINAYGLLIGTLHVLQSLPIPPYDNRCEAEYQRLRSLHPRQGSQDLKIAAVTLVHHTTLLTRNRLHFAPIVGLTIADWTT
jgi:tRNA(fMet)-specific endonuclease VapC